MRDLKVGLRADVQQNCKNPSVGLRKGLWPPSDEQPPRPRQIDSCGSLLFRGPAIREKSDCADISTSTSRTPSEPVEPGA